MLLSRPALATCVLTLVVAFAFQGAQAQQIQMTPELARIVDGAKKEGKLLLRSTTSVNGSAEGAKVAQAGIKKMFDVDLDVQWVPGPPFAPLAAALFQEKQAGQAASGDVYVGTAIQITPYLTRGLFKTVDWVKLMPARIKPELVEGGGQALRFMTFLPGINYNVKSRPGYRRSRC